MHARRGSLLVLLNTRTPDAPSPNAGGLVVADDSDGDEAEASDSGDAGDDDGEAGAGQGQSA